MRPTYFRDALSLTETDILGDRRSLDGGRTTRLATVLFDCPLRSTSRLCQLKPATEISEVTVQSIESFIRRFGRAPAVLQLERQEAWIKAFQADRALRSADGS